jgi:hypothetical protein
VRIVTSPSGKKWLKVTPEEYESILDETLPLRKTRYGDARLLDSRLISQAEWRGWRVADIQIEGYWEVRESDMAVIPIDFGEKWVLEVDAEPLEIDEEKSKIIVKRRDGKLYLLGCFTYSAAYITFYDKGQATMEEHAQKWLAFMLEDPDIKDVLATLPSGEKDKFIEELYTWGYYAAASLLALKILMISKPS